MEHRVIFGEHVQPAAGADDAFQLSDDLLHMRYGLSHVAADGYVMRGVRQIERESIALTKLQARRQRRMALFCMDNAGFEHIDAKHACGWIFASEPASDIARAAPHIYDGD